jgi:hypothetical protein
MLPAQFPTGARCSTCGTHFVNGFIVEAGPGRANHQWLCASCEAKQSAKGECSMTRPFRLTNNDLLTTLAIVMGLTMIAFGVVGCSDPVDPCAGADQVIETPMVGTTSGDTLGIITLCVFNPR